MSEYYVWRVTNGRVGIIGRDGKRHRYSPGDEFICDEEQLRWRREQVQYLRPVVDHPTEEQNAAPEPEQPASEGTEPHDPDGAAQEDPEASAHTVHHRGGGWWDVYDARGERLTDKPLREQEARQLAGLE